jgi:hypothetical protein
MISLHPMRCVIKLFCASLPLSNKIYSFFNGRYTKDEEANGLGQGLHKTRGNSRAVNPLATRLGTFS